MNYASSGTNDAVSVGSTATLILAAGVREVVIVQNLHASDAMYVGFDSDVDSTNGTKVAAGASLTLERYRGDIYGIRGSTNDIDTRYLEY